MRTREKSQTHRIISKSHKYKGIRSIQIEKREPHPRTQSNRRFFGWNENCSSHQQHRTTEYTSMLVHKQSISIALHQSTTTTKPRVSMPQRGRTSRLRPTNTTQHYPSQGQPMDATHTWITGSRTHAAAATRNNNCNNNNYDTKPNIQSNKYNFVILYCRTSIRRSICKMDSFKIIYFA